MKPQKATTPTWKVPRIPIGRLCTLNYEHAGVPPHALWTVAGYRDMHTHDEHLILHCIGHQKKDGQPLTTRLFRHAVDCGMANVFRKDLIDPAFLLPKKG